MFIISFFCGKKYLNGYFSYITDLTLHTRILKTKLYSTNRRRIVRAVLPEKVQNVLQEVVFDSLV